MAETDIDQNLEGEENVPLLEEQFAIPDAQTDIFQMGDGPSKVGKQDLEAEREIILLRPRSPPPSTIDIITFMNAREPLRFGQQHGRGMEFHNVPRLHIGEGDGPAPPLEVNIPTMIMGQGDGILAHPDQINPSQGTRNSTVSSIHGTAIHQIRNTGGEGEDRNSRGNINSNEGPQ
ncbi:hypothetical protein HNY73_005253 [Argiope bruennichi]|uniref:Uncharacterized protein n=1 Tax=Argiope bruennichi TaxID=94029 RepID=A0A8T0FIC1_ARGBR|nr:hypothetical protein HNY73_005253 [Argiope bruennichi]